MTDLLGVQTGRPPLAYDQTSEGREQYVKAATAAFRKDYTLMTNVTRHAMEQARRK